MKFCLTLKPRYPFYFRSPHFTSFLATEYLQLWLIVLRSIGRATHEADFLGWTVLSQEMIHWLTVESFLSLWFIRFIPSKVTTGLFIELTTNTNNKPLVMILCTAYYMEKILVPRSLLHRASRFHCLSKSIFILTIQGVTKKLNIELTLKNRDLRLCYMFEAV